MTFENNIQKKCGFCGESIPANTSRCPYCGSILEITFDNNYGMNTDNETLKEPDQMQQIHNPEESADNSANQKMPYAFQSRLQNDASQNNNRSHGYVPENRYENYVRSPLSNGMKVFLTAIFTLIPGIGQLAGIITAIIFMNAEGDSDRKSFGVAILVASLIMFVLSCIGCFIAIIAISSNQVYY